MELRCARAVFVLHENERLVAMLSINVDDGMLYGDINSKEYQRVRREIDKRFDTKQWKPIGGDSVDYLGMDSEQTERLRVI